MFIKFFKNNNPSLFFILPLFTLALWAIAFFNDQTYIDKHSTLLFEWCINPINKYHYVSTISSFLLLIIEAFLFNHIINENEVVTKRTFLPALFYVVFMSNNDAMLTLHPSLIANLFILIAINRLLHSYRKENAFSESFDAGFSLSIASLFYFPSIVLFPLLGVGLLIFRSFNWREWVISFLGVLTPYCYVITYYFWNDSLSLYWKDITSYFVLHDKPSFDFSSSFYFMMITGLIIVLLSFGKLPFSIISGSQKNKKNLQFIFWIFLFSVFSFSIAPDLTSPYFSVLAIPASALAVNYYLNMKKEWLGELLFILFITSILINDFAKYF